MQQEHHHDKDDERQREGEDEAHHEHNAHNDEETEEEEAQHNRHEATKHKGAAQPPPPSRQSGASSYVSMETDSMTAPCLVARIDNARVIHQLLKAIHFKDRAVCVITQRGFKFTVEDAKSVQAHSYLQERFPSFLSITS